MSRVSGGQCPPPPLPIIIAIVVPLATCMRRPCHHPAPTPVPAPAPAREPLTAAGNHDYYEGSLPAKLSYLRSLGIKVLYNDRVTIPPAAAANPSIRDSFDLVGVPDWAESVKPGPWNATDLPGAVAGRNASKELVVIAHQPKHAPQAGAAGAGLVLSGHVHCGQLLPIHIGALLGNPYFRGLYTRVVGSSTSEDVKAAIAAAGGLNAGAASDAWHTNIYLR